MFLGDDLLPLLVLALGGALLVGNGFALLRPPPARNDGCVRRNDGEMARAPISRTIAMMVVGLVATIWAVATLTS